MFLENGLVNLTDGRRAAHHQNQPTRSKSRCLSKNILSWKSDSLRERTISISGDDIITIHMPQKWILSSSLMCIIRKTRANRILVE